MHKRAVAVIEGGGGGAGGGGGRRRYEAPARSKVRRGKYKMYSGPKAFGRADGLHEFKRTLVVPVTFGTGGMSTTLIAATTQYAFSYDFSQVYFNYPAAAGLTASTGYAIPGAVDLTALFDQLKIIKVKQTIHALFQTPETINVGGAGATYAPPFITHVEDLDDSNAATGTYAGNLNQYSNVKYVPLAAERPCYRVVRPKYALNVDVGGARAQGTPTSAFLNSQTLAIWRGMKMLITVPAAPGYQVVGQMVFEVWYQGRAPI